MRDKIRFVQNGRVRELENVDPTQTVLNFLRYIDAETGTKEGCAEGDCGACTVVLGELKDGDVEYQAVNACIQFLPMLDGKELITVENLKSKDGTLHPVQQAMVEANGSQCGFCTPGFVMSIFAELHGRNSQELSDINNVLAGNLCRCTGYGTIIDAAQSVALQAPADHIHARRALTSALLSELQQDDSLALAQDSRRYYAPKTSSELADLIDQYPDATILAGATDIGLWVTKQHRQLDNIIYVGNVTELKELNDDGEYLNIGAAVTYSHAWKALADLNPDLGEIVRRIASTQIRNSGTIGGNVANGSPIGDMPPPLIALNARLILRSKQGARTIALEDFFIEYGRQDLKTGEFVEAFQLPLKNESAIFKAYKISKRFDQDISALCGAFNLVLDGNIVKDIRICYGGMAGTPHRAAKSEQYLQGKDWTLENVQIAMTAMAEDYTPMSDMRASQDYRMLAAQNLLKKFFIETTDPTTLTRLVGHGRVAHA
ncbi:xanthine dehydrogenase small subunit [Alphaproteobacteria bacterium 46_93_T64]|nr:xanthine dehydrogenase small subunit [Alphaproteobacteria bacterium 46_93_T64]